MTYFLIMVLQIPTALMLPRSFPDLESCLRVARRINADVDYPGVMYCATRGAAPKGEEENEGGEGERGT